MGSYRITYEEQVFSVPRILVLGRMHHPDTKNENIVSIKFEGVPLTASEVVREFGRRPTSEEKQEMSMHVDQQRKEQSMPPLKKLSTPDADETRDDLTSQRGHDPQYDPPRKSGNLRGNLPTEPFAHDPRQRGMHAA